LTTDANELMTPLHNRMPVFVAPADFDQWLGDGQDATKREQDELQHLLRPAPEDLLTAYPVSPYVSNARNEGEACIVPLS
ncbi:MAG: SOS response-associated peptidase family protein, partial [Caldilineaceae bacterium]